MCQGDAKIIFLDIFRDGFFVVILSGAKDLGDSSPASSAGSE
jgi:hypothetical protein